MSAKKKAPVEESFEAQLLRAAKEVLKEIEAKDLVGQIRKAIEEKAKEIAIDIPPIEPPPPMPPGAKSARQRKLERRTGPIRLVLTLKVTKKD